MITRRSLLSLLGLAPFVRPVIGGAHRFGGAGVSSSFDPPPPESRQGEVDFHLVFDGEGVVVTSSDRKVECFALVIIDGVEVETDSVEMAREATPIRGWSQRVDYEMGPIRLCFTAGPQHAEALRAVILRGGLSDVSIHGDGQCRKGSARLVSLCW